MMRNLARTVSVLVIALASLGEASALDRSPWVATSVRGVAVYLVDEEWTELGRGQSLVDPVVRTLENGQVSLKGENTILDLGPGTALRFLLEPKTGGTTIQQYSGKLELSSVDHTTAPITVQSGRLTLTNITGALTITIRGSQTELVIDSGHAATRAQGGHLIELGVGTLVADASGSIHGTALGQQAGASAEATSASSGSSASGGSSGNASSGNASSGNASSGNASSGNASSGNAGGGNASSGNASSGGGGHASSGGGGGGG